jgi:flagellar hook-associated protein 2
MASLQLSGLASGFDWKSFVDTIMDLERAPANRLETEKTKNLTRVSALNGLETRLGDLRSAVAALNAPEAFGTRSVTAGTWNATAAAGSAVGSHTFNVTRLATASRLQGAADIGAALAPTADVSGLTLASLGASATPTAGFFSVNGARVTIATTDSLQDVFTAISTATGGAVTAAYDPASDRVTLASAAPITLGAANDTSNFLSVARLAANGTGAVASATRLGVLNPVATLAAGRLSTAVTAVDGAGAGTFTINGVEIAYNLNTDSLNAVVSRINAAGAGVTAAYDASADRFTLTNAATGSLGISVSESAGGLLGALGLTSGASLTTGLDAQFTVNGGEVLTSRGNTLTAAEHGLAGLTVTASSIASQSVVVSADTTGMRSRIDTFITRFNAAQSYLEEQTRVTSSNGKVSTATLASNREVQAWATTLRSSAFASVPGLGSAISSLDALGIDFVSGTSNLSVKDTAKLTNALNNQPAQVAAFFQQASTGFAARLTSLTNTYLGVNGGTGQLASQRTAITNSNASIDRQIADIDRRLVQRRAILESSFIAMESAQSRIKNMQSQLASAFPANTTK